MSSTRKRLKSALPVRARPIGRLCSRSSEISRIHTSDVDGAADFRLDPESSILQDGSSSSRSSVGLINEVVSKFDDSKRELVRSIGFQSILEFPVFKQLNRKFSMWLMSCVNVHTSPLTIGDHINLRFSKNDVAHVIGIPAAGKHILDIRYSSREAKERVLNELLPPEFKEFRSIKVVQEVIERHYDQPMSKLESDRFRVALVVFVASILLAPSAKYDYACVDYWNAIQDPDEIGSYDWCDYVVVRLLEGVTKLKQDLCSNIKFPNITSCSMFLQVLYLDSIVIEGLSKPHTTFPRIIDFSHDKMRQMIHADRNYARFGKGHHESTIVHLMDPSKCIYSWAHNCISQEEFGRDECLFAVWEATVAMVHLLKIPMESAGPIFAAAADFEEQINSGLLVSGIHAIKFMSVLVSIMIPYSRGFSYQDSSFSQSTNLGFDLVEAAITNGMRSLSLPMRIRPREPKVTMHGNQSMKNIRHGNVFAGCSTVAGHPASGSNVMLEHEDTGQSPERYVGSVIASLDDIPHKLNINLRVATAMSQFYSFIRKAKAPRDFDLNSITVDETLCAQVSSSLVFEEADSIASPWDMGIAWCYDDDDRSGAFSLLNSVQDDYSYAIVHTNPKYIQVSVSALCDQIIGHREFEVDLMDALVRTIVQEDDDLYASFGSYRWRHYFESELMEAIMTGSFDLVDSNLRNFLCLSKPNYNMTRSKLVFFPALLHCSWVCFTWNLESNELFVFEATYRSPVPDFRIQTIQRAAYLLKIALQTLSRTTFHGVFVDATAAVVRIVTLPHIVGNRFNRSGVLCLYFCRCFDGHDLNPKHAMVVVDAVAAKLLKDVMTLKLNSGSLPSLLIKDL